MNSFTIKQAIAKVTQTDDLSRDEARHVMAEIMDGRTTPAQIGSLITAMRMKGESIDELTGFAEIMRSKANRVQTEQSQLLDTCGTGGDGGNTFNISTAAAIVSAAGNVRVAKHGNRAMSSKSGSADVLEALDVQIGLDHQQAAKCLEEVGICFMFAQKFHQSMKHAAGPRKEIGIRTIFNMLGPLTNPAGADRQLLGVFAPDKTEVLAHALQELHLKRAMVVSSLDGLDEISISAPTQVTELKDGQIKTYEISPDLLGLKKHPIEALAGGDANTNAEIIKSVFNGEKGARRDIILANAGACFYLSDLCSTLQEGVKMAAAVIDSGKAKQKLQDLINITEELSHVS